MHTPILRMVDPIADDRTIVAANPHLRAADVRGLVTRIGSVSYNLNELPHITKNIYGVSTPNDILFVSDGRITLEHSTRETRAVRPGNPNTKHFSYWEKQAQLIVSLKRRRDGTSSLNMYRRVKNRPLQNMTSHPTAGLIELNRSRLLSPVLLAEIQLLHERQGLPWAEPQIAPERLRAQPRLLREFSAAEVRAVHDGHIFIYNAYPGLFAGTAAGELEQAYEIFGRAHADMYPIFRSPTRTAMLSRLLGTKATQAEMDELAAMLTYERLLVAYLFRGTISNRAMLTGLQRVATHSILTHAPLLGKAAPGYAALRSRIWGLDQAVQTQLFESLLTAYGDDTDAQLRRDTLQRLQYQLDHGVELLRSPGTVHRHGPRTAGPADIARERVASNPWHSLQQNIRQDQQQIRDVAVQHTKADCAQLLNLLEAHFDLTDGKNLAADAFGLVHKISKETVSIRLGGTVGGDIDLLQGKLGERGTVRLGVGLLAAAHEGSTSFQKALYALRPLIIQTGVDQGKFTWAGLITGFGGIIQALERSLRANGVTPTPTSMTRALTVLILSGQRGRAETLTSDGEIQRVRRRPISRNFWRAVGDTRLDAEFLLWVLDTGYNPDSFLPLLDQPRDFLRQMFGTPLPPPATWVSPGGPF